MAGCEENGAGQRIVAEGECSIVAPEGDREAFDAACTRSSASLNASFDSSLLRQEPEHPDLLTRQIRVACSWDGGDHVPPSHVHHHPDTDLPPSSARKIRRSSELMANDESLRMSLLSPRTTRKSTQTESSAKRRKAPMLQHAAPIASHLQRIARISQESKKPSRTTTDSTNANSVYYGDGHILLVGAPSLLRQNRAPKSSLGTHITADSSSLMETTTDTAESSADTSGDTSTPFRFATFPASLPRIHNLPLRSAIGTHVGTAPPKSAVAVCPASVRKRMSFGDNASSEADVEDSSISSMIDDARELEHEHVEESHDVQSTLSADLMDHSTRTRLNFSTVSSPSRRNEFDSHGTLSMHVDSSSCRFGDLYDSRRAGSFASSVSSAKNNSVCCDDDVSFHIASSNTTPLRGSSSIYARLSAPQTPREVKLHFQLEAAQCSPIPGIPEEDLGDLSSKSGDGASTRMQLMSSSLTLLSSSRDTSGSSEISDCKGAARPMPDATAFECNGVSTNCDRDQALDTPDRSLGSKDPISPRLICPPTPMRTPAWAHPDTVVTSDLKAAGPKRLGRSNSLITTKILATCSQKVLDGRTSQEGWLESRISEPKGGATMKRVLNVLPGHSSIVASPRMRSSGTSVQTRPALEHDFGPPISMENQFEILSTLGKGTFADVFKVRSKVDSQLYAVKRNRRQFRGTRDRDMALAEVKCMQRLQNVCKVPNLGYKLYILFFFQAWQEDGYFYCQTELCCRDTCRELFDSLRSQWKASCIRYPSLNKLPLHSSDVDSSNLEGRLFPESTIWKICHDVGAGLSHIHSNSLVHFDIKPSNIFFVHHNQLGAVCKIGDFGMAGEIASSEDGQEGDQKYMAPELLSSDVKHPSADIFSFGLTLYELASSLSFQLPSEGVRWQELRSGPVSATCDIPSCRSASLITLIKSMLSPSRTARPEADAILRLTNVSDAAHSCDAFLRDYLFDIEEYDRGEEQQRGQALQEDQTPRHAHSGRSTVCSPADIYQLEPPLMHSPGAAPPQC